jgi:DNA primase small subunit
MHVHQNPKQFEHREISYLVKLPNNDEYCLRHQGYSSCQKFREDVLRLNPVRIDMGPIYDNRACLNKDPTKKLRPILKEFVIDIDMDQYDLIRTCCKEKSVCDKCWPFISAAYEVLNDLLSQCFGFKHILWVFSGRRGVHAWICDQNALKLSQGVRKSISEFLNFSYSNLYSDYLIKPTLIQKIHYPLLK